jgi:primosomal protein N' (replication factor Y)
MSQLFEDHDLSAPQEIPSGLLADVALEQGIDLSTSGLTYAVPQSLADLSVGQRVVVPLGRGNKPTSGYVMRVYPLAEKKEDDKKVRYKAVLHRDPHEITLTPDLIELAKWMAAYYCCPIGMVLATMLPAAVKKDTGRVLRTMVSLAENPPEGSKLTGLQKAVVEAARKLHSEGEPWVEPKVLADIAGAKSVSPVQQLLEKKWLVATKESSVASRFDETAQTLHDGPAMPMPVLNNHQQKAVDRIAAGIPAGFGVHVLHGVTGSGKTEVYLRAIEALQAHDPQAGVIVLVPEIALTPQTVARFLGRFEGVAVLHSGLTAAQRHQQWRRIREGQARIVVGARSAIFAPLEKLGLIIVDEEHEYSYKQDQLPRYHARDVAVKRGHLCGIPVVLGSATPSLESYYNAVRRKTYHLIELPERVMGLKLPRVQIVDMTEERRHRQGVHLMSQRLEQLIEHALQREGQVLLLLNRRGYANYIACPDHRCGWMQHCEYCDASMVYHKDAALPLGGLVRCHHCNAEQMLPQLCPVCSRKVTVFGLGVQRVEEELLRKFPKYLTPDQLLRMDSDTMRTGQDYFESLEKFRRGQVKVLVGTQMIAKGLDFPNVRVVGVISGDTSLNMPDFRASERTFQLIAQVAGRAGRAGESAMASVVVQTFNPEDPSINAAAEHDYPGFAEREMTIREEAGLPPATRMARIVVRDKDLAASVEAASILAGHLATFNEQMSNMVQLRGPAACPVARVAEHYRQQIELTAPDAATLQKLLTLLRNARVLQSDASTAVDVDPVDLL